MTSARWFPLAGIAFVGLVVCSLLVGGQTPDSGASASEVASFYDGDAGRQWFSAFLAAAAAPFAVLFGIGLADALSNGTRSRWGDVVRAGGILVAGAALVGTGVHIAVVDGGDQEISDTALQALNTLDGNTWIAFTSGLGVLLLGAAGAMLTSGSQRVLGWSALVLGVALYLPFVDFLAMLAATLWIVVASVVFARESAAYRRAMGANAATTAALGVLGLSFALALSGCGGSDDESATASASVVPAELVGTYERTVSADAGLPEGVWKLALGPAGEMFIVPPGETGFFNSPITVEDDRVEVPADPESGCTGVGTYSYTAASPRPGGELTLTVVSDDLCPDRAALLGGGPFTATD